MNYGIIYKHQDNCYLGIIRDINGKYSVSSSETNSIKQVDKLYNIISKMNENQMYVSDVQTNDFTSLISVSCKNYVIVDVFNEEPVYSLFAAKDACLFDDIEFAIDTLKEMHDNTVNIKQ